MEKLISLFSSIFSSRCVHIKVCPKMPLIKLVSTKKVVKLKH